MGVSGPTPLRGRSRLSKVHLGGVQGRPAPSNTKGSGPLRTCQSGSDAGWTGVLAGVTRGPMGMRIILTVGLEITPRPPNFTPG